MPSSPATRNEPPDLPRMLAQASTLQRQGQVVEAERLYLAVLAIMPDNADALHSMGNLKLARGEPGEALRLIGAAMAARAPTPRILFDLGLAFNALNQHQKALDSFDLAIQLQPDFFEAHGNRGAMLAALGQHGDAIESYRKALAIRPDFADAHCNLGSALTQLQRYDEALASLDRALALRADYPDALYNRGNALKPLQRYEEALASYDRAIALQPNHADAHNNRGQVLRELERYDEALASYDRALALRPRHVMAHCNAAALRLLTGDFERGWAHYEWRWLKKSVIPTQRNFSQPAWTGRDPIAGKTILIHSEQGLGDTIQFCRYVPLRRRARCASDLRSPETAADADGFTWRRGASGAEGRSPSRFRFALSAGQSSTRVWNAARDNSFDHWIFVRAGAACDGVAIAPGGKTASPDWPRLVGQSRARKGPGKIDRSARRRAIAGRRW